MTVCDRCKTTRVPIVETKITTVCEKVIFRMDGTMMKVPFIWIHSDLCEECIELFKEKYSYFLHELDKPMQLT